MKTVRAALLFLSGIALVPAAARATPAEHYTRF